MLGLEIMLAELESSGLEVVLVPCRRFVNEGGCIRVVANKNCDWYRRHCARHASDRRRVHKKFDTRIKRANTVRVLERLIAGKPCSSKYVTEFLRIATQLALKSA